MMTPDRKPWLFLKRINSWNPWGSIKHAMVPRAERPLADERDPRQLVRSRWI